MNLKQLRGQIEQDALDNFYVVSGEEPVLIDQTRRHFVRLIDPTNREMNYSHYDLNEDDIGDLLDDASSLPFFGDHRVILVDNPLFLSTKGKLTAVEESQFLGLLQAPVLGNIVVFMMNAVALDKRKKVVKELIKTSQQINLPLVNESQAQQLIRRHLTQRDYGIDDEALQEMVLRTNASYTAMLAELPKLLACAKDSRQIDLTAVEGLVPKQLHAHVFDLIDAVMQKEPARALRLYRNLVLNGEAPLRINALLLGQFRLLLQVAGIDSDSAAIAGQLGVHPYRVKLAQQVLNRYNLSQLRQGYLDLQAIEIALKSTSQDPVVLFERFLLKV